ncbi:type II secretion system protein GspG [Patescibacteria group bacterium]|nr:type II secretion system protein GspG [Patescibacteria group bacterium]MBU4098139.1 type II secretion system protein GspG [Patescibacteria group bacterium]
MLFKDNLKSESGFTLVELLVVIAIIVVMVGGLILILNPAEQIAKVNDAKRKGDLGQLQKALELYYQDYGKYPVSTATYTITGSTGWGGIWSSYMTKLPIDPTGRIYRYYAPIDGQCANYQCYFIYGSLEKADDIQACNSGAACVSLSAYFIPAAPAVDSCGGTCNYGVSSSNVRP